MGQLILPITLPITFVQSKVNLMDIIFLFINDYSWSCLTNILQVFCDQALTK